MSVPEVETRLEIYRSGVLDAQGTLQISAIGPARVGERWVTDAISTAVDTGVTWAAGVDIATQTRMCIFKGTNYNTAIEGTDTANMDTTTTPYELQTGEVLSFWWTEGPPGSRVQLTIRGKRYIRSR